ncbi:MAG: helix-turn-helix transcriptional regulator [bacterium]|nr:helix-turn-helix transcriptional regulator [bacterium]
MKRKFNLKAIASRVKTIRKQNNLSTIKMAEELGVCISGYRKCERAENGPSQQSQILLAEKYDVSLDWLLLNKGPMHFSDIEKAIVENKQLKQEKQQIMAKMEEKGNREPVIPPDAVVVTAPEIKELLQFMEDNPLFKFQLLAHLYRFKQEGQNPVELPLPEYEKKRLNQDSQD